MKRRRKATGRPAAAAAAARMAQWLLLLLMPATVEILLPANCMVMMSSNCLASSPGCGCSWKGGKFVANCSGQNLTQVPNNDYYDYLLSNAGNNQMPTLNRDIQQLELASNGILSLEALEFSAKKFKNLQKIHLNSNQLLRIHPSAFHKLTGLIELDLSDNLIASLALEVAASNDDWLPPSTSNSTAASGSSSSSTSDDQSKKTKQTAAAASEKLYSSRGRPQSFLASLGQLRHLNLASNQLTEIEEFAFTPLKQLRQLYLSRNKISYIDKRAFDGLNVLNILHLDGNKLSHLDGQILAQLPQLHSLQLAGSNPWLCDCRLRKLVRNLLGPGRPDGVAIREKTTNRPSILQDEPQCFGRSAASSGVSPAGLASGGQAGDYNHNHDDDDNDEDHGDDYQDDAEQDEPQQRRQQQQRPGGRGAAAREGGGGSMDLWTNMKLEQLECKPKLAPSLKPIGRTEISLEMLMDERASFAEQQQQQRPRHSHDEMPTTTTQAQYEIKTVINSSSSNNGNRIDKTKEQPLASNSTLLSGTIRTIRQHYLGDELIQLTCAFELNDELDLDYSHLEWWLVMNTNHHHQQQHHHHHNQPLPPHQQQQRQQQPHRQHLQLSGEKPNQARLIWRSSPKTTTTTTTPVAGAKKADAPMKDEPTSGGGGGAKKFAAIIMDYVTRANGVGRGRAHDRATGAGRRSRLVRISHLIADAAKIANGNNRPEAAASQRHQQQQQQPQQPQQPHQHRQPAMPAEAQLLCRITNQAGHVELLHSLLIDSNNKQAQAEARARRATQEAWLGRADNNAARIQSSSSSSSGGIGGIGGSGGLSSLSAGLNGPAWPPDRARARVADELAGLDPSPRPQPDSTLAPSSPAEVTSQPEEAEAAANEEPLFIPLYLSRGLQLPFGSANAATAAAAADSGSSSDETDFELEQADPTMAASSSSLARSLGQLDHQRPATRQTNATASAPAPPSQPALAGGASVVAATAANSNAKHETSAIGSATYRQRVQSNALALVRRFTSNHGPIEEQLELTHGRWPGATNDSPDTTVNGGGDPNFRDHSNGTGFAAAAASWTRALYMRYLDRWLQLAIGEAPLLLAVCAGLLAGCLLTTVFILRLHCAKQRRVRDQSAPSGAAVSAAAAADLTSIADRKPSLSGSCADSACEQDAEDGSGINSPHDDEEEEDEEERRADKQTTGASSSSATANGSQRELITVASPGELALAGSRRHRSSRRYYQQQQQQRQQQLRLGLPEVVTDQAMELATNLSGSEQFCSCEQSDEADASMSAAEQDLAYLAAASCSSSSNSKLCGSQFNEPTGHRLIVVSPQQDMQELILSPSSFEAAAAAAKDHQHHQRLSCHIQTAHSPYADGDLYHFAQQVAAPKCAAGRQADSRMSHHQAAERELPDCRPSVSASLTFHRPAGLMMTAPSKLRSIEALDNLYQGVTAAAAALPPPPPPHAIEGGLTTLARNQYSSAAYAGRAPPVAVNYGYASSSSLVTSPAASTSSTSMTSGVRTQHHLYGCTQHQPNAAEQSNQQWNAIYLNDALKLLNSSINDCLN